MWSIAAAHSTRTFHPSFIKQVITAITDYLHTGLSKKILAKFSDSCSVRADGLCIGSPRLVGGGWGGRREFQTYKNFFATRCTRKIKSHNVVIYFVGLINHRRCYTSTKRYLRLRRDCESFPPSLVALPDEPWICFREPLEAKLVGDVSGRRPLSYVGIGVYSLAPFSYLVPSAKVDIQRNSKLMFRLWSPNLSHTFIYSITCGGLLRCSNYSFEQKNSCVFEFPAFLLP